VTDGEALIRSILAAPADDAPRLVYADWLDERGRAEDAAFVRVQCELARLGFDGAFHTDERGRLRQVPTAVERLMERQMELWADSRGRPDLPPAMVDWPIYPANTRGVRIRVRRGFVERVSCPAEEFMAVAGDLFARQPVTHVRLVDLQPLWDQNRGVFVWDPRLGGEPPGATHYMPGEFWHLMWWENVPVTAETVDLAETRLSWACVRHGRILAGLEEEPSPR
jgi:uncharacterized protein (TIGR02996 family)